MKKASVVKLKRVYEGIGRSDGARYLVERLWPRGIKKVDLKMNTWLKDAAPSSELRRWFGHDPAKLDKNPDAWKLLLEAARQGNITLLYSARDTEHNNAIVLKAYLEERLAD